MIYNKLRVQDSISKILPVIQNKKNNFELNIHFIMNEDISFYIINIKERTDRKKHILHEFEGSNKLNFHLIDAKVHKIGAIGLWDTIKHILLDLINNKDDFFILCEDDHQFTNEYSEERLIQCIEEANKMDADILSGGVSGFTSAMQVSSNLYWVEKFSGLQFTVIFRRFFQKILEADFGPSDAADYKICSLSSNKFFIYPFISIQKDFGYSDATPKNNKKGRVEELFSQSIEKVHILKEVSDFYKKIMLNPSQRIGDIDWDTITIPTYVINLPERIERKIHIKSQFMEKKENYVTIVEACKHKIGAVGLWLSIRKIIKLALKNEDDVIIICEDDHEFTTYYNRNRFIADIFQAGSMGCNILSGGIGSFNTAFPVTKNLWWIDSFWCTQFIVIYKKFFEVILNEPFCDVDTADGKLSEMTSNKMVLYPFISVQKDFGYSDVTDHNNKIRGLVNGYFEESDQKLDTIYKAYNKHQKSLVLI